MDRPEFSKTVGIKVYLHSAVRFMGIGSIALWAFGVFDLGGDGIDICMASFSSHRGLTEF